MTERRHKSFPMSIVTTGRTLLIAGGCMDNLCRLRHAIAFDWKRIIFIPLVDEAPLCDSCVADSRVDVRRREITEDDVRESDYVIETARTRDIALKIAEWTRKYRIPLNSMDKLDLCDLHYPALVMKGPLILSILSGGDAPALSSRLRQKLEQDLGPGWELAAKLFVETRNRLPGGQDRIDLLKNLAQDPELMGYIERADEAEFREWIDHAVNRIGNKC